MCWVALDRGLRLAGKRSLPVDRLPGEQDAGTTIYQAITEMRLEPPRTRLRPVLRLPGARRAALLLMPLMLLHLAHRPPHASTLDAIEQGPGHRLPGVPLPPDRSGTGSEGREGTFSMCSFWLVECLPGPADLDQARLVFEKMLGYANHLGLYAEEIGPRRRALGNFPQAFTHLGLISAAFDLDRRLLVAGHAG